MLRETLDDISREVHIRCYNSDTQEGAGVGAAGIDRWTSGDMGTETVDDKVGREPSGIDKLVLVLGCGQGRAVIICTGGRHR